MKRRGQDTTEAEAKRIRAAVLRVTGEWYCSSSNHYTKSPPTTWRGRRICTQCKTKMQALRKTTTKRKAKP